MPEKTNLSHKTCHLIRALDDRKHDSNHDHDHDHDPSICKGFDQITKIFDHDPLVYFKCDTKLLF